jgi:broad specificity phosphatase PhoE/GNAT superfamily N-acetyltransferase
MAKIYLIQSAEAEEDRYRIIYGSRSCELTARGLRQAAALKKRFAGISLDRVYSSGLHHACVTAEAVAHPQGLAVCQLPDLREIDMGLWEGQSWGNIAQEESQQLLAFKSALQSWRVEGAESPTQAAERMAQALRRIAAENTGKTVAAVSHPFAVKILLAKLEDLPLEHIRLLPESVGTSVAVLEASGDCLGLVSRQEAEHLCIPEYQGRETSRKQPDFNTDICFYLLRWVEYGEIMAEAVKYIWEETGEERPFNRDTLLNDAALLQTTVGYAEHMPAGFLQMGTETGWITLLCVHPECRGCGMGTQFLGQAVLDTRRKGGNRLHIALPKRNPHRRFFLEHGFAAIGETPEGKQIMEKVLALCNT